METQTNTTTAHELTGRTFKNTSTGRIMEVFFVGSNGVWYATPEGEEFICPMGMWNASSKSGLYVEVDEE